MWNIITNSNKVRCTGEYFNCSETRTCTNLSCPELLVILHCDSTATRQLFVIYSVVSGHTSLVTDIGSFEGSMIQSVKRILTTPWSQVATDFMEMLPDVTFFYLLPWQQISPKLPLTVWRCCQMLPVFTFCHGNR